jgi:hemoglobin
VCGRSEATEGEAREPCDLTDETTTLFEIVGGQQFFDALVERFYGRVEADRVLRPVYPANLEPGKRALALFLGQYWGGPAAYSAENGHPRLRMRHAPFAIGGRARDAWLSAMLASVDEADAPEIARERLSEYFTMASTAMINRAQEAHASPTGELPEPKTTGGGARMDR